MSAPGWLSVGAGCGSRTFWLLLPEVPGMPGLGMPGNSLVLAIAAAEWGSVAGPASGDFLTTCFH